MGPVVLMVAEKNSIAQAIAAALAPGGEYATRRGQAGPCPVYEFAGKFNAMLCELRGNLFLIIIIIIIYLFCCCIVRSSIKRTKHVCNFHV